MALQSPLGHDFQCLEASVSFRNRERVKRERVDFGLISSLSDLIFFMLGIFKASHFWT